MMNGDGGEDSQDSAQVSEGENIDEESTEGHESDEDDDGESGWAGFNIENSGEDDSQSEADGEESAATPAGKYRGSLDFPC